MAEDLVGKTLGNYRVESLLGSGGMGEVYRAIHTKLNRPAAIKVLHAYQAGDPNFQARFLREARSAAALAHPNIVEVFDFGEQDGDSYLVMELVPDGSLRTLLRQRSADQGWSLALGLNLVQQAAEGLAYANAQGMVHRDVKPDNLLLRRRSEAERGSDADEFALKISDFGLARLAEGGEDLTASGMVVGTPTYMSPEQCQGAPLDGRSDLYSLGVVLYEVAVGHPPFRAKSLTEAVFKHISEAPVPPRQLRPDLPVALDQVILRCLAKRPEDRYATAYDLIQDLQIVLSDTEMNTIIGTSDAGLATPSTPAPVDPVAPTVVDSSPSRSAVRPTGSSGSPRPSVNASGVAVRRGTGAAKATKTGPQPVVAKRSLAPGSTVRGVAKPPVQNAVAQGATKPAQTPTAAPRSATRPPAQPQRWPLAGEPEKSPAGAGALPPWLRSVTDDPRRRNIGLGAVGALVALVVLIVMLASHASAPRTTASTKPTATNATSPTASPTPVDTAAFTDSLSKNDNKWAVTNRSFFSNGGYQNRQRLHLLRARR